jgi:TPR repeat protein
MTVKAQEKKLDCDFNFREALFYLKGDENFKKDSLKSIEFLKPCLKIGDAKAQLLMARLYTAKKDEKNYKKAFKLLKKSAKQGNAIAAGDLGVLYKYGRGCNLNFNKARKWFKKAAELGNNKAS